MLFVIDCKQLDAVAASFQEVAHSVGGNVGGKDVEPPSDWLPLVRARTRQRLRASVRKMVGSAAKVAIA